MRPGRHGGLALGLVAALSIAGCDGQEDEVVVYTSVDQTYSEPILERFEAETGIEVQAVYDLEAAKTTGLVNRLIAEADRPQADVFWNGEVLQMQRLAARGLLARQEPGPLPEGVRRAGDGRWLEFGGRARVLIVNETRLGERAPPRSLRDLAAPAWPADEIAVAYPMFGTTATHAVALDAAWGRDATLDYFGRLQDRGVRFVDGNAVVRDLVAAGDAVVGLTDTDDACGAVARGAPVAVLLPDQEAGGLGTLVIPNSVAMLEGAPHPEEAARLIAYLVGAEVAARLAEAGWFYVSGAEVVADPACGLPQTIRAMPLPAVPADEIETLRRALGELLVR